MHPVLEIAVKYWGYDSRNLKCRDQGCRVSISSSWDSRRAWHRRRRLPWANLAAPRADRLNEIPDPSSAAVCANAGRASIERTEIGLRERPIRLDAPSSILATHVHGVACPPSEDVLRRQAKHDLTDRLVMQYPPLALLRDRVNIAQTAFERIFLEHRHRSTVVKQRVDDLP